MGKMESAGDITARLAASGWTGRPEKPSQNSDRRQVIQHLISKRIFLNFERPGPDRLVLLVEDALRLWRTIPTEQLTEAVEAAIISAGAFPATTALVAKLWLEDKRKPLEMDYAALGRRDAADLKRALEAPGAQPPTAEERERNAAMARAIADALARGKPLEGLIP